jgi:hypothetical protein
MITDSHFDNALVFLRDGHVIDLHGMSVDDGTQFIHEIERVTNQGVVIVARVESIARARLATPHTVRES